MYFCYLYKNEFKSLIHISKYQKILLSFTSEKLMNIFEQKVCFFLLYFGRNSIWSIYDNPA